LERRAHAEKLPCRTRRRDDACGSACGTPQPLGKPPWTLTANADGFDRRFPAPTTAFSYDALRAVARSGPSLPAHCEARIAHGSDRGIELTVEGDLRSSRGLIWFIGVPAQAFNRFDPTLKSLRLAIAGSI
jgi:hypothetical protein